MFSNNFKLSKEVASDDPTIEQIENDASTVPNEDLENPL